MKNDINDKKLTGALYVVATPIGNFEDMSFRAIETLKRVDLIAAEDTRRSRILLRQFSIDTRMLSYHNHNEVDVAATLISVLQAGQSVALICDAGTPLINDPGYRLVQSAHAHDIPVHPIPGPCAMIAALSVAGVPPDRFAFEGYLPAKLKMRKQRLHELISESRTLIFYEAPHRIVASIKLLCSVFGEHRRASLARELTKQFEQVCCATLDHIQQGLTNGKIKIKGECVIIIEGAKAVSSQNKEVLRIHKILCEKLSLTEASQLTAKITGKKKNEVYRLGFEQKKTNQ